MSEVIKDERAQSEADPVAVNGEAASNNPPCDSGLKRDVRTESGEEDADPPSKKAKTGSAESTEGKSEGVVRTEPSTPGKPPKDPSPSTPSNQPIGGGREGAAQRSVPSAAQVHQSQHPSMGYPPQMMGGMMHGQYPPSMMQGYAPYPHPHGYPGQPQQSMMMGQQQQAPGQLGSAPPGTQTPTTPSGGPQQQSQQHPQAQGYYGQPGPHDGSQQQSMGTSPGAQNSGSRHPGPPPGSYQQMPGMMPMQMPMHMMHYGPPGMFFPQYSMPGAGMMNPMMAQAFNGNPHNPSSNGGRSSAAQQQTYMPAPPPRSAGTPLSLSCDDEQLSEYQMLVRKQLEIFEAQPEDVESNTQGRKKQVVLGQVSALDPCVVNLFLKLWN